MDKNVHDELLYGRVDEYYSTMKLILCHHYLMSWIQFSDWET